MDRVTDMRSLRIRRELRLRRGVWLYSDDSYSADFGFQRPTILDTATAHHIVQSITGSPTNAVAKTIDNWGAHYRRAPSSYPAHAVSSFAAADANLGRSTQGYRRLEQASRPLMVMPATRSWPATFLLGLSSVSLRVGISQRS